MYIELAIPEVQTFKSSGLITKTHTNYLVLIQVNLKDFTAVRRYKDFHNFSKTLQSIGNQIPKIPPKVWSKLSAKVVQQRQTELEKWLQELVLREELLQFVFEFLGIEAPPEVNIDGRVNDGEKAICQLLFRLRLNQKNTSNMIDAFSAEFFRVRQKIKPSYAQQLIDVLIPLCSHEFSAAKTVNVLAKLIDRSKCLDSKTFEEQLHTFDAEKLRSMNLNTHIRRINQGDSFESSEKLLVSIYEHLKSAGVPQTIELILNNDDIAIDILYKFLDATPTSSYENDSIGPVTEMDQSWINMFGLEGIVLQRRQRDALGEEYEIKTEFMIESNDLQHAVETYLFRRHEWSDVIDMNVVEWINEDQVVVHLMQFEKAAQRTEDYVTLIQIQREVDRVIITAESTEHEAVPEKLGIQRQALIKTTVTISLENDQIRFLLTRLLTRQQMKTILTDMEFVRMFLENLMNFKDFMENRTPADRRPASLTEAISGRKMIKFN